MFVLSIVNSKGGSGKSTLTANLGAALADMGLRTLLIDLDQQPTLSGWYPLDYKAPAGIYAALSRGSFDGVISETALPNLDVIRSDDPEGQLETWIRDTPDGRVRLRFMLEDLADTKSYDIVLIDNQGSRGAYQDVAALAASMILCPIPPEVTSAREFMRGVASMVEELKPMGRMGAPLGPLHAILYMTDRTRLSADVSKEIRRQSALPNNSTLHVLDTVVPTAVAYRTAAAKRTPVHVHDPHRTGSTPCGREIMRGIIAELLPHLAEEPFGDEREAAGAGAPAATGH